MDSGSNDKLSALLSNPESLKLLAGIAKSVLGSGKPAESAPERVSPSDAGQNTAADVNEAHETTTDRAEENYADSQVRETSYENDGRSGSSGAALNANAVIAAPKKSSFDERADLLRSIKPYLKEERRDKVDSIVKALDIAKLINNYTGGENLFNHRN